MSRADYGTLSNTEKAFAKLRGTDEWDRQLCGEYAGRMFALEHPTLAASPIENALALSDQLPEGARLHLLTHSRGGLVGELLSLASVRKGDNEPARSLLDPERLSRADPVVLARERKNLTDLIDRMYERNARVERFVRVACPAAGTTILGDKLDRWATRMLNIIIRLTGAGGPVAHVAKKLILSFLDQRTDPRVIPGLEAQRPGSTLVSLVNTHPGSLDDGLAVIAGDLDASRGFGWAKDRLSHLFFRGDNDLVVDTSSMYRGAPRANGMLSYHYGPEVNHSAYFSWEPSRLQVTKWLLAKDPLELEGFKRIERDAPKLEKERGVKVRGAEDGERPIVLVIPAFMGSALLDPGAGDEAERVRWPSAQRLGRDGITLLGPEASAQNAAGEGEWPLAARLLMGTYGPLIERLENDFVVETLPFDWRVSLKVLSELIDAKLHDLLDNNPDRSVHVVAHSYAGLAVRLIETGEQFARLAKRKGRSLLLGTPANGSHHALQLATGHSTLAHRLALIDPTRQAPEIGVVLRSLPWVLEALPRVGRARPGELPDAEEAEAPDGPWWRTEWWTQAGVENPPAQEVLDARFATLAELRQEPEASVVLRVLGVGRSTPGEVEIIDGGGIEFRGLRNGDGMIEATRRGPDGGPVYYVEASHGELVSKEESLDAYVELLNSGASYRVATDPGELGGTRIPLGDRSQQQLFPTDGDLERAAMGVWEEAPRRRPPTIHVSVSHGDLKFAPYPVMVGHFDGDTIVGAEEALDKALQHRLTKRDVLGIYPGALGSAEVIRAKKGHNPPGAVIIGIGEVGELNASKVTRAVTEGALRLAMEELDLRGPADRDGVADEIPEPLGISPVLIGATSPPPLAVQQSAAAVVRGVVLANQRLDEGDLGDRVRVTHIDFVELYEDVAIEGARSVRDLPDDIDRGGAGQPPIVATPHMRLLEGGRPGSPGPRYWEGKWQPILIENQETCICEPCPPAEPCEPCDEKGEPKNPDDDRTGQGRNIDPDQRLCRVVSSLTFKSIGLMARAESMVHEHATDLVKKLVVEVIGDRSVPEQTYNTLYELLLPNYLKSQTRDPDHLIVVVDAETSQYPWEMLAVRTPDGRVEPLSVNAGMIRRLLTSRFRSLPERAAGYQALVVGDPPGGTTWPRLLGARREAAVAVDALSSGPFKPAVGLVYDDAAGPNTDGEILNALFEHDYRVIHIAAHGAYEQDRPEKSGVVIGPGSLLTAAVIGQMRTVPQLVFLNCCHVGRMEAQADGNGKAGPMDPRGFNHFAATISEQLIRDGVRAIVAAGWAIEDRSAAEFARVFYEEMLEGHPFGVAVLKARKHVHERFGRFNTWGAYQCYGDPGYKLVADRPKDADPGRLVAGTELHRRLRGIDPSRASPGEGKQMQEERERHRGRVERLLADTPRDWHTGPVNAEAARALGELGYYEEADKYYERAAADWKAESKIKTMEQRWNLMARHAGDTLKELPRSRDRSEEEKRTWKEQTKNEAQALERLRALLDTVGQTPERLSMMESIFDARARRGHRLEESIEKAADSYGAAYELHKEEGGHDSYSANNWMKGVFP